MSDEIAGKPTEEEIAAEQNIKDAEEEMKKRAEERDSYEPTPKDNIPPKL